MEVFLILDCEEAAEEARYSNTKGFDEANGKGKKQDESTRTTKPGTAAASLQST